MPPYRSEDVGCLENRRIVLEFDLLISLNHHNYAQLLGVLLFVNPGLGSRARFQNRMEDVSSTIVTHHHQIPYPSTGILPYPEFQ